MGFDKPDLGFVIHYQRPGSVSITISRWDERAGSGASLWDSLSGDEDQEITNYFIQSAFRLKVLFKKF